MSEKLHVAMTLRTLSEDLQVLTISCLVIGIFYFALERYVETEKGRSWIVMLLSSGLFSFIGVYYVLHTEFNGLWTNSHIYGEESVSRCVLLYFIATNLMDLALGVKFYRKYMDPLSTIAHHTFYIAFISILLAHGYSRGFMLCLLMEIPTFILAVGSVWKEYRSDALFGVSFLLTRLLFNVYLAYRLALLSSFDGNIWKVCICVLCLHAYWFSKWTAQYGSAVYATVMKTLMTDESRQDVLGH